MDDIEDDKKYSAWIIRLKCCCFEDEVADGLSKYIYEVEFDDDENILTVTVMVKTEDSAYRVSENIERYINDWWDADAYVLGVDRAEN